MKKALLFAICICSISTLFAKPFTPQTPVAAITIMANNEISWEGETAKSGGLLKVMANKDAEENDNDDTLILKGLTKPLMNDAVNAVYEVFAEEGIELIDENAVLNSDAYSNAEDNKMYKMALNVTKNGYKLIGAKDDSVKNIISEVGASSAVIVNLNIQKTMVKGVGKNGTMTAFVNAVIEFCDASGKTVKSVNGFAKGSDVIDVKMDKYDAVGLAAMYPDVIREALKAALAKTKK